MTETADLIVIGAGPGGANAALAAARAGLSVVLIDEQPAAGGQVWRAPWPGLRRQATSVEARQGNLLRTRLAESTVDVRLARRAWSVTTGFRVDTTGPDGNETFAAPRLVAAPGAHERVVPFPGWTLPGVIGLAAATVLLKSHGVLPGRRVVVAGCGPLLAAVAAGILKLGGDVAAVADLSGRRDWLDLAPRLATRPRLLWQGMVWSLQLAAKLVPIYFRHTVLRADGADHLDCVRLAPADAGSPIDGRVIALKADALCVGHGLVAGAEVTRMLRARHVHDPLRGGWIPDVDPLGHTSVPGLFTVGDGAAIRGVAPAEIAGEITGLAVAQEGRAVRSEDFASRIGQLQKRLRALEPFSSAAAGLMRVRPAQVAAIPSDTVVCRCEDVTRSEIDAAFCDGAREMNQLKHFTRCGMGPCQGRMCGEVTAELLGQLVGGRQAVGYWTGRPPLRPVNLDELIGVFAYGDIPIPEPAPL